MLFSFFSRTLTFTCIIYLVSQSSLCLNTSQPCRLIAAPLKTALASPRRGYWQVCMRSILHTQYMSHVYRKCWHIILSALGLYGCNLKVAIFKFMARADFLSWYFPMKLPSGVTRHQWWMASYLLGNGPLTSYAKLWVRMRRECQDRFPSYRFQRKPLVNDPSMHHGTCVTFVP